jgi:hypothetical protein
MTLLHFMVFLQIIWKNEPEGVGGGEFVTASPLPCFLCFQRLMDESKWKQRGKVVAEILHTEQAYVNQLHIVMEVFYKPLKVELQVKPHGIIDSGINAKFAKLGLTTTDSFTQDDLELVFGGLLYITKIHEELLQDLENLLGTDQKHFGETCVGETFKHFGPFFRYRFPFSASHFEVSSSPTVTHLFLSFLRPSTADSWLCVCVGRTISIFLSLESRESGFRKRGVRMATRRLQRTCPSWKLMCGAGVWL